MADDNRPLKYARYAIGEIILVVIGILIALQINTWNEEQKTRILQTETLKEIRANLELDLAEINFDIDVMDSVSIAGEAVIHYLESGQVPSGSFKYHVHVSRTNPHFDAIKGGYSLLISKGLDIISNDSLRGAISKLYESNYPYYEKYENERVSTINDVVNPKLAQYFSFYWVDDNYFNGTSDIDQETYEKLKNDSQFINVMNLMISQNKMVRNRAERTAGFIKDLIDFIDEELEGC